MTWLWILGGIVALYLLCGIGFAIYFREWKWIKFGFLTFLLYFGSVQ